MDCSGRLIPNQATLSVNNFRIAERKKFIDIFKNNSKSTGTSMFKGQHMNSRVICYEKTFL